MKIQELMTREVLTVTPDTTLKDVAALLAANGISGAPVCDSEGRLLGVISEADILRKEEGVSPDAGGRLRWLFRGMDEDLQKVAARTAGEAMTSPALTVRPTSQVAEAARIMVERRINRLPVVWDRRLVGIVSRSDLVRAFDRSDEEIAREIREDVLSRMLWLPQGAVATSVEKGLVTLCGEVETRADADALVYCVRRVPGVIDVSVDVRWRIDGAHPDRPPGVLSLP